MLRITVRENSQPLRLELAGKLAGPWVTETEKAWRAARYGSPIEVDLSGVTGVDEAGRCLLRTMAQDGAHLIAKGLAMTALVKEIEAGQEPASERRSTADHRISRRAEFP